MQPIARVVLIGASNVELHLASLLDVVRGSFGDGPLDVLIAAGCGRAYAVDSHFLARGLPAVLECGLWPALEAKEPLPLFALLTDVGNDLAFGVPPARLAAAIEECAKRLCVRAACVVVTLFPETSVARTRSPLFYLFRSVLFPGRRFSLAAILTEGREVNARLGERLGGSCAVLTPAPEWYGIDRIHLRRRARIEAWKSLLAPWDLASRASSRPQHLPLRGLAPERSTLLGVQRVRTQPSANLADGTTISLF